MNFFNFSFGNLKSAAFLLIFAALLSRVLGLVRDRILAGTFGAGDTLDIYFAAFRIPDLIFNLVIAGSISAAFIPVFIGVYAKNKEEAWRAASNFLNIALIALVVLAVIFSILTPLLMPIVAPGFSGEKMAETIYLTRIMFLSTIFLGLSAILSGILHSFKRFLAYALAPLFYNGGIIFGALVLVPSFGVQGLAWGVVVGAFFHFLIQVPPVLFSGYAHRAIADVFDPAFRKIFFLIIPRAIGMSLHQFNLWVTTAIASTLPVGSVAVLHLASNIHYLPIGIFGISFAIAAFPSLSESAVNHEDKEFRRHLSLAARLIFFFVFPLSVLLFVLRAHIVRIFLGTGEFGWGDTRLTAAALGLFCFGIFAQSLTPIFARAFFALQNTKTPVLISSAGILLNIALSGVFVFWAFDEPPLRHFITQVLDLQGIENVALLGLPLAFSLSSIGTFLLFFVVLQKYIRGLGKEVALSYAKVVFASLASGFAAWAGLFMAEPFLDTETLLGITLQATLAALLGSCAYLILMFALRAKELSAVSLFIKGKLHRPHAP